MALNKCLVLKYQILKTLVHTIFWKHPCNNSQHSVRPNWYQISVGHSDYKMGTTKLTDMRLSDFGETFSFGWYILAEWNQDMHKISCISSSQAKKQLNQ